jgi:NADPH:quinone reductase-like Zn-dependent oxidoreductase
LRALVYDQYCVNDDYASVLQIKDIPEPTPKPNEVVFRVRAAALNYDDIWGMRGAPLKVPLPHISGSDVAGDVIAIGDDVSGIKVGDRIVSHGNMSCRICKNCMSGREFDCKKRKVWGFETGPLWGGYCEITHLPEVNAVKIPEGISYEQAAASSMTLMTAWHMLVGRAQIKPGQLVLIMGGGSGMGIFGIQIAKLFGCTVIATASGDKLEKCIELGADHAIDHRKEDWYKQAFLISKEFAKSKDGIPGIDVIFEHIGGTHWNKELTLLKYGATLVTTGATTGYDVVSDLRHIFFKGTNILGSTLASKSELEDALYWVSKGKIRPVIDSVYDLEHAAEAHTKMLKGNLFGKIIIKP